MEHVWPSELDSDATCEVCGLRYSEWSDPETLNCEGE